MVNSKAWELGKYNWDRQEKTKKVHAPVMSNEYQKAKQIKTNAQMTIYTYPKMFAWDWQAWLAHNFLI